MIRILYVDDDVDLLEIGKEFLEKSNEIQVDVAISVSVAQSICAHSTYDAIIADYQMPEMTGIDYLKLLRSSGNNIPFVLFTGRGREEVVIEALNSGADFYVQKGGNPIAQFVELEHKVRQAIRQRQVDLVLIESEERFRCLAENSFEGIAVSVNGVVVDINGAMKSMLGYDRRDLIGRNIFDFFTHESAEVVKEKLKMPEAAPYESQLVDSKGKILTINIRGKDIIWKGRPARLSALQDVTGRKEDEERMGRLNRELLAIKEMKKAIVRAKTEKELLSKICHVVCDEAGYRLAWIGFAEDDEARSVRPVAWAGHNEEFVAEVKATWADDEKGWGPTGTAIRTARTALISECDDDETVTPWKDSVSKNGYRSGIAIPLMGPRRAFGALTLYSSLPNRFTAEEISILEEMVGDLTCGIMNLRAQEEKRNVEEALRSSRQRYEMMFSAYLEGVAIHEVVYNDDGVAIDYRILEVNPAFEKITNISNDMAVGKLASQVYGTGEAPYLESYARVAETGEPIKFETLFPPTGKTYTISAFSPIKGQFVTVFMDMTEQRISEEKLRRDEARNRALFELAQMTGLACKDIAERAMNISIELTESQIAYIAFLSEDEKVLTMQHYSKQAMDECKIENKPMVFRLESTGLWAEAVRQRRSVITNDYSVPDPSHKGLPSGHVPLIRHMSIPVFDRGRIVAVAGVGNKEDNYSEQDAEDLSLLMDGMWRIIRKIQAEDTLRESEAKFRSFVEQSSDGFILVGEDGQIIEFNAKASEVAGIPREEALTMKAWEVLNKSERNGHSLSRELSVDKDPILDILRTGQGHWLNRPLHLNRPHPDGSISYYQVISFPIKTERGWRIGISIRDMTAQTAAEEDLKSGKLQLSMAMDLALLVYWEYDLSTDSYTFNDRFYAMYGTNVEREGGYTMTTEEYHRRFVHPDDIAYVIEVSRRAPDYFGNDFRMEHRMIRRDGEVRTIAIFPCQIKEDNGAVLKVFGLNQDITEGKKAADSLMVANLKLNLLSSITRHDITNQLTIQSGYLELIKVSLTDPAALNKIHKIEDSIKVVEKQIGFTRDYEEMGTLSPQWQSVGEIIRDLPDLKGVEHLVIDDKVGHLSMLADPMLNKVFHNLFENGRKYGGDPLNIMVECHEVDDGLSLTFMDNGPGIPAEDKEKVFMKGFGKGSGLGLFLSREILALTGIMIMENGRPGDGARFEMIVPNGNYRFD